MSRSKIHKTATVALNNCAEFLRYMLPTLTFVSGIEHMLNSAVDQKVKDRQYFIIIQSNPPSEPQNQTRKDTDKFINVHERSFTNK